MGSKRRSEYSPIGKNPQFNEYHRKFDTLRLNSPILNAGDQSRPNINTVVDWSKSTIESLLLQRVGDKNGEYFREREAHTAHIPFIKMKLAEIDAKFKSFCQGIVNSGRRKPTGLSSELLQEQLRWHAQMDVTLEEIEELERMLKTFVDKEVQEDDTLLLKKGLVGSGNLKGGILDHVDGQKVEMLDGQLIITSKSSPYRGMLAQDYYDLVCKWKNAKSVLQSANNRLHSQYTKQGLEDKFPEAWNKLKSETYNTNPEFKDLFGLSFRGKQIPVWPKDAVNYFEKKEIEDSSSSGKTYTRKRKTLTPNESN